jgi:O-antigen ligase
LSGRGVFFIGFFASACVLSLAEPFWGVAAYVTHYHTFPELAWWGRGLSAMGVRYSFLITAFLAAGTLLNLGRLPYGRLVNRQEALYLTFLGWMVLLRFACGEQNRVTAEAAWTADAVDKMLKVAVFVLAMTHVVVTPRQYERFAWLLVACALYLGREAYSAPASSFSQGRLEGIGGPDFSDANSLASHVLSLLPCVGVQFLRGGWRGKTFCLLAAALGANTIVLTRTRAAYIAVGVGLVSAFPLAPKGARKQIACLTLVGVLGAFRLADAGFLERMATVSLVQAERDESSQSRIVYWGAGVRMIRENPMGVGPDNFAANFGRYLPGQQGRDAHNTYIRCAAELGLPGLLLFAALVVNAFRVLARLRRTAASRPGAEALVWHGFALQLALIMYLTCGFFNSFTYHETLWWMLLLPAALERAVTNSCREAAGPA